MQNGIHFISGLPRSGSTLLAALLRQNPRLHAGMTSPLAGMVGALLRQMSQENETSLFIDNEQRRRILHGVFTSFYADIHPHRVVFDTSRIWTAKMPLLAELFPQCRVICCVRNPAWIIDSIEQLVQRNPLEPSRIFNYEPGGTVYSRTEGLSSGTGMAGVAWNALREAVFGNYADRLLLVRYETLTTDPLGTLAAIYNFIGEPAAAHDPARVQSSPAELEFDARLGAPGLHALSPSVRAVSRKTVLPPDLFERFSQDAFWDIPKRLPKSVRLL